MELRKHGKEKGLLHKLPVQTTALQWRIDKSHTHTYTNPRHQRLEQTLCKYIYFCDKFMTDFEVPPIATRFFCSLPDQHNNDDGDGNDDNNDDDDRGTWRHAKMFMALAKVIICQQQFGAHRLQMAGGCRPMIITMMMMGMMMAHHNDDNLHFKCATNCQKTTAANPPPPTPAHPHPHLLAAHLNIVAVNSHI